MKMKKGPQATAEDIVGVYRLFLRRDPENEHAIVSSVGQPFAELVRMCLSSEEFRHNSVAPVVMGEPTEAVAKGPHPDVAAWASERFPLSSEARSRLLSAPTWVSAYSALFEDAGFRELFGEGASPVCPEEVYALKEAARLQGEVFGCDGGIISGWARWLDRDEPVALILWSDGAVIGNGLAMTFDRGLEQRIPGAGQCAFRIVLPAPTVERVLQVQVREASTGRALGELQVRESIVDRGTFGDFKRRIDDLALQVSSLQQSLPDIVQKVSTPIQAYTDYRRRWLEQAREVPPYSGLSVAVVLDGSQASALQVEAAVRSIIRQTHPRLALHLIVPDEDSVELIESAGRYAQSAGFPVEVLSLAEFGRLERLGANYIHLMDARAVADCDLISAAAQFLDERPSFSAVYFDEDALVLNGEGLERGGPRFKPSFDEDLLLQEPYIGASVTLSGEIWRRVSPGLLFSGAAPSAAVLRVSARGGLIGHEPVVLQSLQAGAVPNAPEDWMAQVAHHLATIQADARPVMEADILSAPSAHRHRVRWPVPAGVRVSVIVPTRDRLDLLRPCLESLFGFERDNQAQMEVIIVDHQSSQPETKAYLNSLLETRSGVRVVPYEGAFNWALMNNLAAVEASGDVLVFLNNDTVAVSPDWLDELAGQALRPEIGVVGVRLIYPDGTLQHGGFVAANCREGFLEHEGVGGHGCDGGYLGRHAVVRRASAVTGACMAIAADKFGRLGGFEGAAFPVDGNDVDLCFRARAEGLSVLYTPFSTFYHLESKTRGYGSSEAQSQAAAAAVDRLWERWGEFFGEDPFYNRNFDRFSEPFTRLIPPLSK